MHFLFPASPRRRDVPDDFFGEQADALAHAGFTYSTVDDDALRAGGLRGIPPGRLVVYRGWMLDAFGYDRLATAVTAAGGVPFTTTGQYLSTHHLPNWYPLIPDLTPETRVYPADADLVAALTELAWGAYFVKDYVKSLKTSVGSLVHDPALVGRVVDEMRSYRGEIEGGVCVRRVEDFLPETETRYFVVGGTPFAPGGSGPLPEVVRLCADRIPAPFFSVDIVRRRDGVMRVVEVGDGQVSDLVGWSAEAFAAIWRAQVPG